MAKCGVIKFCDHLVKKFEDLDYEEDKLYDYGQHPPNCFHSHAAATAGSVILWSDTEDDYKKALENDVLILLVDKTPMDALDVSMRLKADGKVVLIGLHENLHALQHLVHNDIGYIEQFIDLLKYSECDALYYSTTKEAELIWSVIAERAGKPLQYLNICCDKEMAKDFYVDPSKREGILIGTRVFNNFLMRNTLLSLSVAASTNIPTTFVWRESTRFDELEKIKVLFKDPDQLTIITGNPWEHSRLGSYMTYPLDYVDWLKLIARHQVCLNIDFVMSQGDVPADCFLVNVPCIGGNGDSQMFTFGYGRDTCHLNNIKHSVNKVIAEYSGECHGLSCLLEGDYNFEQQQKSVNKIYARYK